MIVDVLFNISISIFSYTYLKKLLYISTINHSTLVHFVKRNTLPLYYVNAYNIILLISYSAFCFHAFVHFEIREICII